MSWLKSYTIVYTFFYTEFNLGKLLDLEGELPDELRSIIPENGQNGAKDVQTQQLLQENVNRHQQLSQLLSSNSTTGNNVANNNINSPQTPGSVRSPNIDLALNSVKSPASNNLGSPPGMGVRKTATPNTSTQHSLNHDGNPIMNNTQYNCIASSNNSVMGSTSVVNSLNNKQVTSQTVMNTSSVNMHPGQMMNGPNFTMSGGAVTRTVASGLPGNLNQGNVLSNALGTNQVGNPQGLSHPGLNANQAQLMKVNVISLLMSFEW